MISAFNLVSLLLFALVLLPRFPGVSVGMLALLSGMLCAVTMPGVVERGLVSCVLRAEVVVVCCLGSRYVAESVT